MCAIDTVDGNVVLFPDAKTGEIVFRNMAEIEELFNELRAEMAAIIERREEIPDVEAGDRY
jgi:hypothetical protein